MRSEGIDWVAARQEMLLDATVVNLNAGTLSPTPRPVMRAVEALRARQANNPTDFMWRQSGPLLADSRAALAAYLNCPSADLLLLPNVTWAINLAISALRLPAGGEVLMSDHEYGAMVYAWRRLAGETGLKLREFKLPFRTEDPAEIVRAFEEAITPQTRVLYFSHSTFTTGLVLPAEAICAMARRRGLITVIDGAHAPGMIDLDLHKVGADFYAANCHKWLMAPCAAGFLHVSPAHKLLVRPAIVSWGWGYEPDRIDSDYGNFSTCWQWNLEFPGTVDRTPQMVMRQAIDFRRSIGGDAAIAERIRSLSLHARRSFAAAGIACASPENPAMGGALTSFEFPDGDALAMRLRLWEKHRIECPIQTAAGKNYLRVSHAFFNTPEEIDLLATTVRREFY